MSSRVFSRNDGTKIFSRRMIVWYPEKENVLPFHARFAKVVQQRMAEAPVSLVSVLNIENYKVLEKRMEF